MTPDFRKKLRRHNVERAWYLAEAITDAIVAATRALDGVVKRLRPKRRFARRLANG